jgi:hypothetical protein
VDSGECGLESCRGTTRIVYVDYLCLNQYDMAGVDEI